MTYQGAPQNFPEIKIKIYSAYLKSFAIQKIVSYTRMHKSF